ncbi:MAG TPA: hypothetical protein VFQ39_02765 [Longimicrobium sp.]|nr:hypothetical protein [Longimicrobium sp.]
MSDENTSPTYESPFDQLLTLEEPEDDWASVDYRALGLTSEHVGELAQIALEIDAAATDPEYYASVHAWRALAQFGDEAAIAPLDDLLRRPKTEDDD